MGPARDDSAIFSRSLARANNFFPKCDFGCLKPGWKCLNALSAVVVSSALVMAAAVAGAVPATPIVILSLSGVAPVSAVAATIILVAIGAAIICAVLTVCIVITPVGAVAALIVAISAADFFIARRVILAILSVAAPVCVAAVSLGKRGSRQAHDKAGAQDTEDHFTGHFVLHHE